MAGENTNANGWSSCGLPRNLQLLGCALDWQVFHLPLSHCIPVHSTSHVQVSGAVQVPPFWQGLVHTAAIQKMKSHGTYLQLAFAWIPTAAIQHTLALGHTSCPPIKLASPTVWSLQCVAYITGVGHYRVVGCTGESALAICRCARITTDDGWRVWNRRTTYVGIMTTVCSDQCLYIVIVAANSNLSLFRQCECSGLLNLSWHTCFTLHSSPPHITGASVRSCAGPSILTGVGTDGCGNIWEDRH